jgi:hypothetical protein
MRGPRWARQEDLLGALTFVTFNPDGLTSQFTALPVQILNWISPLQRGVQGTGCGGHRGPTGRAAGDELGRDLAAQPLLPAPMVTPYPARP